MRCLPAILALALGLPAGAAFAAPVHLCGRVTVVLPSAEAHRVWLEKDVRYGPDLAAAFAEKVKRLGPRVLETQILVADETGASLWFDLEGLSGLREAKRVRTIKKLGCDTDPYYPLALLIGLTARSITRDTLFVAKSPGNHEVISIKNHPEGKPFAVRHARTREIVCRDIRACEDIAGHPRLRR